MISIKNNTKSTHITNLITAIFQQQRWRKSFSKGITFRQTQPNPPTHTNTHTHTMVTPKIAPPPVFQNFLWIYTITTISPLPPSHLLKILLKETVPQLIASQGYRKSFKYRRSNAPGNVQTQSYHHHRMSRKPTCLENLHPPAR